MPFRWREVGAGPEPTEIEISIFGPGFGECIVVHVGGRRWLIVDSCVDASDRADSRPVAERYLGAIGVDLASEVDLVVASHWHDDHVRGLGRLVEICKRSEFSCAHALLKEEFYLFIKSMNTGALATDGAKVREFSKVLNHLAEGRRRPRYAVGGRPLISWDRAATQHGESCTVRALSPSDAEFEIFLRTIGAASPTHKEAKRSAPSTSPNLTSVVLHIQFDSTSVLLCADMEVHNDQSRGWGAVVAEGMRGALPAASVVKVAHHGSANGHATDAWTHLIQALPIAVVTPYNRMPLDKKLPTVERLTQLASLTSRLFITAPRSSGQRVRERDPTVHRGLRDHGIELRDLAVQVGMVRLRRQVSAGSLWRAEVFPPATQWSGMA